MFSTQLLTLNYLLMVLCRKARISLRKRMMKKLMMTKKTMKRITMKMMSSTMTDRERRKGVIMLGLS